MIVCVTIAQSFAWKVTRAEDNRRKGHRGECNRVHLQPGRFGCDGHRGGTARQLGSVAGPAAGSAGAHSGVLAPTCEGGYEKANHGGHAAYS
ncbi:hypothetical protein CH249_11715 [Rhodococcus sp. 05-2255-3B1]|nr:hypothetical protein CH250_25045 [Rhodococcus sp. 05-2255-3C]OZE11416.1 hypothetical protein CH249_11715 [Rhodococcus sp. 05-2255-3B1]OZE13142.1 hypothetical protein CH255_25135 [Rhodococcus sp. 05-2255-2A2]